MAKKSKKSTTKAASKTTPATGVPVEVTAETPVEKTPEAPAETASEPPVEAIPTTTEVPSDEIETAPAEAATPAEIGAKPAAQPKAAKPKKLSALDAAAQVLAAEDRSMTAPELIEAMATRGLWDSPNGKTPAATLYAAMLREITTKGQESRFTRPERGKFALKAAN
jgi:hypothetical protein